MPVMDQYEYLETANDTNRPVAELIHWAYNETYPNTYSLFLDLIGWTEEHFGETIYDLNNKRLGYVELSYLADALEAYSNRPNDIRDFVDGYEQAVMDNA